MSKLLINKELITNVANLENKKFIKQTNKNINNLVGLTIKHLQDKLSFISLDNVILQPANELLTGAIVDSSDFDYILGINSPQLEMNTLKGKSFWENLKEKIQYAWQNRKSIFNRRNRKKRRKKKRKLENDQSSNKPIVLEKYKIYNLLEDLQNSIILFLSETSLTYLYNNRLELIGKDDFGANTKIKIYPMFFDGKDYKYFIDKKHGFLKINIDQRIEVIQEKIQTVGDNFIKMLKVFNYLFYNTNNYNCNQILLESILCSVPDKMFQSDDNIYNVFIKIINYLSINSLNVISINNPKLTIYKDNACQNSIIGFRRMINSIVSETNQHKLQNQ